MGSVDWISLVGILVCVVLSAMYSGSETVLTSLGARGGVRLLEENHERNKRLRLWVEQPYEALTAILIGNNLVNITASALVTTAAIRYFSHQQLTYVGGKLIDPGAGAVGTAVAVAIGISTFLLLTFGEIIPKILAKGYAESLGGSAARFVWWSHKIFWPVTKMYAWFVQAGLRATGRTLETDQPVTADDIEFMVNLGTRDGSLDAEQERILTSVFEYHDTTVKEVMVPRVNVIGVPDDISYQDLLTTLVEAGHSRVPVYKGSLDEIIGAFYAKDILPFFMRGGLAEDFRLADHLREPVFVGESKKVDQMLREFQLAHIHLAIVVDEFGGTAGLVTLEDIIEEFFGEIQDEFDREEPLFHRDDSGCHIVDARIRLDELEDEVEVEFPEEHDYESLGGFMTDQLGAVPSTGDQLSYQQHRFTVLESEPTHIVSVRIESPHDEAVSDEPSLEVDPTGSGMNTD